jgi:hypothetical protein
MSDGYSPPREYRGRDKSKQWKEVSRQGCTYLLNSAAGPQVRIQNGYERAKELTSWRVQSEGQEKEVSKWGALTVWRVQRERKVRTWKGSGKVRHSPSGEYKAREVRTRKESELEKGTYMLGNADKRSNEDTKRT